MKRVIFLSILILLLADGARSQCNISESKVNYGGHEMLAYEAEFEQIYRNDDLHNGLISAFASFYIFVNPSDPDKVSHWLKIATTNSGYKPEVPPRQAFISFKDGSSIVLRAESMDTRYLEGSQFIICHFELRPRHYKQILSSKFDEMTIIDHRTKRKIIAEPYRKLFKEQVDCLYDQVRYVKRNK